MDDATKTASSGSSTPVDTIELLVNDRLDAAEMADLSSAAISHPAIQLGLLNRLASDIANLKRGIGEAQQGDESEIQHRLDILEETLADIKSTSSLEIDRANMANTPTPVWICGKYYPSVSTGLREIARSAIDAASSAAFRGKTSAELLSSALDLFDEEQVAPTLRGEFERLRRSNPDLFSSPPNSGNNAKLSDSELATLALSFLMQSAKDGKRRPTRDEMGKVCFCSGKSFVRWLGQEDFRFKKPEFDPVANLWNSYDEIARQHDPKRFKAPSRRQKAPPE